MHPSFVRAALLAAALCALPACRKPPAPVAATEQVARLPSEVAAGDRRVAAQLASGFYDIEAGAWRWTGREFSVILGVPAHAERNGGKLTLAITVPPPVIEKLTTVTLGATVGGTELASETYSKAGNYTYVRELSPALLSQDTVRINFRLDRAMPPGGADIRELGIIVLRAALVSK
jgi:hypothetical protein